VLTNALKINRN